MFVAIKDRRYKRMKNREKFTNELIEFALHGQSFGVKNGKPVCCEEFSCEEFSCEECDYYIKSCSDMTDWAEQEYIEQPNVNWSKVAVDTPIFVRDDDDDDDDEEEWTKRHFYKYVNGRIRTFDDGKTSFTSNNFDDKDGMYEETTGWLQGKLAEEGETHNG